MLAQPPFSFAKIADVVVHQRETGSDVPVHVSTNQKSLDDSSNVESGAVTNQRLKLACPAQATLLLEEDRLANVLLLFVGEA